MKYNPITRRFFLKGMGTTIVSLPFLPSLIPSAYAQNSAASKLTRFIALAQDNGVHPPFWAPPASNKSRMRTVDTYREMNLTDVTGPRNGAISDILGPDFASLRSKMMLLENLDCAPKWWGHQMASILCGNFGRVRTAPKYWMASIDRVMARSKKIYPNPVRVDGLHLRVDHNKAEPEIDLSWDYRNGEMVFPTLYEQPQAAFDAIFNVSTDSNANDKKKLLVDQIQEQFKYLRSNARTSSDDKKALDDHMDMLSDLEKKITATAPTCSPGTRPSRQYDRRAPADRSELIDLHSQILVTAIKCGTTRIATLAMCAGTDITNYNTIVGINMPTHFHQQSHLDPSIPEMLKIYQFFSKKVANILTALNVEEPGTDGTYLDNSIVLYGNGQATGNHTYANRPVLIAGGGGGAIQTNRYIDYGGFNNANSISGPKIIGRNYNQLLVGIMQAMGLSEADYYTAEMASRGITAGYGDDTAPAGYKSDRRNPLPGFLKTKT